MARFITRVQLQDANEHDYEMLNDEMKKESFTLTSKYSFQQRKSAPTSVEYEREGNMSVIDITGAAYRAARRTGHTYPFTVIKDKNISKHGRKLGN